MDEREGLEKQWDYCQNKKGASCCQEGKVKIYYNKETYELSYTIIENCSPSKVPSLNAIDTICCVHCAIGQNIVELRLSRIN